MKFLFVSFKVLYKWFFQGYGAPLNATNFSKKLILFVKEVHLVELRV
jgi:hypothetical protein